MPPSANLPENDVAMMVLQIAREDDNGGLTKKFDEPERQVLGYVSIERSR